MLCPHCGNPMQDDATFCDNCNNYITSSGPAVPEGYQLDPNSGLYYITVMSADPVNGSPVQLVTYYNVDTGEYTQASYPADPQAVPENTGFAVPEGYAFDPDSGLYYQSTTVYELLTGDPTQWVTYFNAETGEYSQASYPRENTEEAASAPDVEARPYEHSPLEESEPTQYAAPDGYQLDAESGLYYQSEAGTDPQTAMPVQLVTYFDPATGEYTQVSYPVEPSESQNYIYPDADAGAYGQAVQELSGVPHGSAPPETEQFAQYAIPDGYQLDPESGLYYQSQTGTDPQTGLPVQRVTYFNPLTGEYAQASYAMDSQSEPYRSAPYMADGTVLLASETMGERALSRGKPARSKKTGGILAVAIAFVLIAGLGTATYFFKWYTVLPMFGDDGAVSAASATSGEAGVLDASSSKEEGAEGGPASTDQGGEASSEQRRNGPLYDFPHTSQYYMQVQQDGDHIYMLQPSPDNYRHATLYRMDKGNGPQIENMNHFTSGASYMSGLTQMEDDIFISGFTLVEDDIYFSVPLDDYRSGYYRVPKSGGEVEFLFVQELSHMVYYEGEIYFMFGLQRSLGIYRPGSDTQPRLIRLVEEDPSDAAPAGLFPEYCLYKGYLYYGDYWEDACTYYRMDLQSNSKEILISGSKLQESYIFNPVYDGNACYYDQMDAQTGMNALRAAPVQSSRSEVISESTFDPDSGDILFFARLGDLLYYQQGKNDILVADLEHPQDAQLTVTIGNNEAYGITEDWLFVIGELIRLSDGSRISTSSAVDGPPIDIRDALKRARELADSRPNDLAIPR